MGGEGETRQCQPYCWRFSPHWSNSTDDRTHTFHTGNGVTKSYLRCCITIFRGILRFSHNHYWSRFFLLQMREKKRGKHEWRSSSDLEWQLLKVLLWILTMKGIPGMWPRPRLSLNLKIRRDSVLKPSLVIGDHMSWAGSSLFTLVCCLLLILQCVT